MSFEVKIQCGLFFIAWRRICHVDVTWRDGQLVLTTTLWENNGTSRQKVRTNRQCSGI